MTMRRIAANVVLAPEGRTEQGVVTIENGVVSSEGKRRAYMDGNPLV